MTDPVVQRRRQRAIELITEGFSDEDDLAAEVAKLAQSVETWRNAHALVCGELVKRGELIEELQRKVREAAAPAVAPSMSLARNVHVPLDAAGRFRSYPFPRGAGRPLRAPASTSPPPDDGHAVAPARYMQRGRETVDRMRDLCHARAARWRATDRGLIPLANLLFQVACETHAIKYQDRAGLKEGVPVERDKSAELWWDAMARHAHDPKAYADPRNGRSNFEPYSPQPFRGIDVPQAEVPRPPETPEELSANEALIREHLLAGGAVVSSRRVIPLLHQLEDLRREAQEHRDTVAANEKVSIHAGMLSAAADLAAIADAVVRGQDMAHVHAQLSAAYGPSGPSAPLAYLQALHQLCMAIQGSDAR